MLSVNSVSGGKTSSYMAYKYPTDINIFSLVKSNLEELRIKCPSLRNYCESKIPNFIGSYESPETLEALRRLEDFLKKEIVWVTNEFALEDYVFGKTDLPGYRSGTMLYNARRRFCTITQKIIPIANYIKYKYGDDPVMMQIGFRLDEINRVYNWKCENDKIKEPIACKLHKSKHYIYQSREWRYTTFPLFDNGITKSRIEKFWSKREDKIKFPHISNCVMCPLHTDIQLQQNAKLYPNYYKVAIEQEKMANSTFSSRKIEDRVNFPKALKSNKLNCSCHD